MPLKCVTKSSNSPHYLLTIYSLSTHYLLTIYLISTHYLLTVPVGDVVDPAADGCLLPDLHRLVLQTAQWHRLLIRGGSMKGFEDFINLSVVRVNVRTVALLQPGRHGPRDLDLNWEDVRRYEDKSRHGGGVWQYLEYNKAAFSSYYIGRDV